MKFFTLIFWFNQRPSSLIPFFNNLLIGIIILFTGLSIFLFLKKKNGFYLKLYRKLFSFFATNAFIGVVLWFFNFELIPVFSARIWYIIWVAIMALWVFFICKYFRTLPEKKLAAEKTKAYTKYIP